MGTLGIVVLAIAAGPPRGEPLPEGALARFGRPRMAVAEPGPLIASPDGKLIGCGGRWFRIEDEREVPPPFAIPKGHTLERWFKDGSYQTREWPKQYLFSKGKASPRLTLAGAESYGFSDDGTRVWRYADGAGAGLSVAAAPRGDGGTPAWELVGPEAGDSPTPFFSPSGSHLAWFESDAGKSLRIVVRDLVARRRTALAGQVSGNSKGDNAAFSPDGKTLVLVAGGKATFFDTSDGNARFAVDLPPDQHPSRTRFTPDGKAVLTVDSSSPGVVHLVPAKAGATAKALGVEVDEDGHFTFLPGHRIALVAADGNIGVYDYGRDKVVSSRPLPFGGAEWVGRDEAVAWAVNGEVTRWDARSGRVLARAKVRSRVVEGRVHAMAFSRDGKRLAAEIGGVTVLARADGSIITQVPVHSHNVDGDSSGPPLVAFSRSGKLIAIQSTEEASRGENFVRMSIRDTATGDEVRSFEGLIGTFRFGRDDALLFGATEKSLVATEVASGKRRWARGDEGDGRGGGGMVVPLFVADSGWRIATVRGERVIAINPLTPDDQKGYTFPGYSSPRLCSMSGDGRWFVREKGGRYSLFDLTAKQYAEPAWQGEFPAGRAVSLSLNADGSRLLTAHAEGVCYVWDAVALRAKHAASLEKGALDWDRLGDPDPVKAQPAIEALAASPGPAVRLIASKLAPAKAVPAVEIAKWVRGLDDDAVEVRQGAEAELGKCLDHAERALRAALEKPASVEQARRAKRLLRRLSASASDPDRLRDSRAVEVLEYLGTPEAVALLRRLAAGAPEAALTRRCREALGRLAPPAR